MSSQGEISRMRRIVATGLVVFGSMVVTSTVVRADSSEVDPTFGTEAQASIAVGTNLVCAVASTGTVKCWGNNSSGQVGSPAGSSHVFTPTDVTGMSNAVEVAAGQTHACSLDDQGLVYCWGANAAGQLGSGDNNSTHVATAVMGLAAPAISIGVGSYHSCAVLDTNELACWGSGSLGALGENVASRNTANLVPGLSDDIEVVAGGDEFTCALRSDGSVTCFGRSPDGQAGAVGAPTQTCFGMPPFQFCQTTYQPVGPTTVTGFGTETAVAISTGVDHACAVLSDGTVACWGRNSAGQLGVAGGSNHVATVVPGVSDAVAVAAGADHTCALTSTGSALCWGSNANGQLGDGTYTNRSSATAVVGLSGAVAITAGDRVTCAASSVGVVSCWGDNSTQQLGRGFSSTVLTPTAVTSLGSGVTGIYGGGQHQCARIGSAELKCWGANVKSQIDASSTYSTPTPTAISGLVTGSVTISSVALGERHTCVGLSDNTMKCWGDNNLGQLGRGDNVVSGVPTSPTLTNVQVAKVFAGGNQSCLVTVDGDAMCWGDNFFGQLGDGTTTLRDVPMTVSMAGGVDVVDIAVGYWHTCFTYTPSAGLGYGVRCVGRNHAGQLGLGNTTDRTTPTQVPGLDQGVSSIVAGMYHVCALMVDTTVKCWGGNGVSELGNGLRVNLTSPNTVAGLSNVLKLMVGDRHTCALLQSGGVSCWGANGLGQIGTGATSDLVGTPTSVSSVSAVTDLSGTGVDQMHGSTCVLSGGAVSCWGSDGFGQAGQGYVPQSAFPGAVAGGFTVAVPQGQSPMPSPSPQIPVFVPPTTTTPPTTTPPPAQPSAEMIADLPSIEMVSGGVVFPGQQVTVSRGGFTPGAKVDAYVFSRPQLVGSTTADANGQVTLTVTVPTDLVGEHSLVLYEPGTGTAVRQAITIAPLTLPVTGSSEKTIDLLVTLALFFIVLGVLGLRKDAMRPMTDPDHQEI